MPETFRHTAQSICLFSFFFFFFLIGRTCLYFYFLSFFIEVYLIYNAVLVSGVQQSSKVIPFYIYICIKN